MIVYTLLFTVGAKVMKNRQNLFSPLAFSILFRVFAAVNNEIPLSNMKRNPISPYGEQLMVVLRRKASCLPAERILSSDGKCSIF
jgi:hypothetical protein